MSNLPKGIQRQRTPEEQAELQAILHRCPFPNGSWLAASWIVDTVTAYDMKKRKPVELTDSDRKFIELAKACVREGLTESGTARLLEIIDKLTEGDAWKGETNEGNKNEAS